MISVLMFLLLVVTAGNALWIFGRSLACIWRGGEIEMHSVQKADRLWTGTAISTWITAFFVFYIETIFKGNPTRYPFILLHTAGLLLLVTVLTAGVTAVALSMSEVEHGFYCGRILQRVVRRDCVLAILIWISAWGVS